MQAVYSLCVCTYCLFDLQPSPVLADESYGYLLAGESGDSLILAISCVVLKPMVLFKELFELEKENYDMYEN